MYKMYYNLHEFVFSSVPEYADSQMYYLSHLIKYDLLAKRRPEEKYVVISVKAFETEKEYQQELDKNREEN